MPIHSGHELGAQQFPCEVPQNVRILEMSPHQTVHMKPSQALAQHRATVRNAVLRYRLSNPRVFGSVLRGCDTEDSDLDLLVDPEPGATLFDLGGLQEELEQLMGLRVDVLTPRDLPLSFRAKVLAEARPV